MQLFFSPPKSQFYLLLPNPNPRFLSKIPTKLLPYSSTRISSQNPLQEQILFSDDDEEVEPDKAKEKSSETVLEVRRPVKEVSEDEEWSGSGIDAKLSEMAKKMSIFEPERVEDSGMPKEKPLGVNLELGLYRAKVLTRKFQFQEAEEILQKCILLWPEDGRAYVALGKLLKKQSRFAEARSVYERGCQATQGENPYIWQCWAVLENKIGNIRKARELFDAATVADKRHIAAWHGWAVLEIKQGNIKKARNLLGKGLKFCGGNEYIYQTLALLEAKGNRFEQARYLFQQATKCNPKSCASWLAWAQIEMQQENNRLARQLFEKAVQASPKNRFAWHVWAIFEINQGNIDIGRKLLKIGHALNPRDPVILQSLALLEYKHSTANLARGLFRRASELDPRHQPVWIVRISPPQLQQAWGWMEWKEGNIGRARELYQKALSINATSESAARCLQTWGVLEQRAGNLSAARRLFRSSLNINSQSYITWMTWASLEEDQGNPTRAEEIRNLYFQQRTEVVDDASWVTGFMDIFDPALDSIKRMLNFNKDFDPKTREILRMEGKINITSDADSSSSPPSEESQVLPLSEFNLDAFIKDKLSLDPSKLELDVQTEVPERDKINSRRRLWRSHRKTTLSQP